MKKLILFAVLALVTVAGVNAQNRFSIKDRVDRMKERLNLTDLQAAQADSILTAARDKVQALPDTVQDRRAAIRQIMTDANADVEKILTDDQKAEYKKMMEERRGRMGRRPNNDN